MKHIIGTVALVALVGCGGGNSGVDVVDDLFLAEDVSRESEPFDAMTLCPPEEPAYLSECVELPTDYLCWYFSNCRGIRGGNVSCTCSNGGWHCGGPPCHCNSPPCSLDPGPVAEDILEVIEPVDAGGLPTEDVQDVGCYEDKCCTPDCTGLECGDGGCPGQPNACGSCSIGYQCVNDQCEIRDLTEGFVFAPAGTFWMGSPQSTTCPSGYPGICADEAESNEWGNGDNDDENLHYVKLTRSFEIQAHVTTQEEFETVMGWNPKTVPFPSQECLTCPVEFVTWYDAVAYANRLSQGSSLTKCYVIADVVCDDGTIQGNNYMACMNAVSRGIESATIKLNGVSTPYDCTGYRLPTESEWEYAARAGSNTAFHPSDGNDGTIADKECNDTNLNQIAWTCGLGGMWNPKPVGGKEPNAWGLYDMIGNVLEIVWDGYTTIPGVGFDSIPDVDPVVPATGDSDRIWRSCGYMDSWMFCRSAARFSQPPGKESGIVGFRLARTLEGTP